MQQPQVQRRPPHAAHLDAKYPWNHPMETAQQSHPPDESVMATTALQILQQLPWEDAKPTLAGAIVGITKYTDRKRLSY